MEKNRNLLIVGLCAALLLGSVCLLMTVIGAVAWNMFYRTERWDGEAQPVLEVRVQALERRVAELESRLDELGQPVEPLPVPPTGGARVTEVLPGTPAEQVGILPDDIITAVDRQPVGVEPTLSQVLASHKPGDRVVLAITRDGRSISVEVTLAENPDNAGRGYLGVRVEDLAGLVPLR